ncbi:kinase-like domain-containing protein [Lasiosphaeria ovina]|uniref:Kinase-like domain-containing protein n=1 Tax=Lasiosphaeria ovina TaxID=92902 RepID=A0AAE0NA08_9PEZI|nr:kinase-like domain-containing protein [Lasiosphaeria ovina]
MRQPHDNDLIQDSRLDVTVLPGGRDTKQLSWVPGDSANERPQTIEEIWRRSHQLGSAAGRQVWVEKCVAGRVGLRRVVKEIKITPLDRSGDMSYRQELYAMAKFSQPKYMHCFVKSLGWFETAGHLHLAMEYMPHGDLQKWLVGPFPETEAAKITSQVVDGLDFMHSSGFAHRDIKPANILVVSPAPKWWVKIADFGISKRIEETSALHTMGIGTSGYMAPEIMGMYHPDDDDDDQDLRYDQKVDIWAMGELVFRMMTAKPSFADTRQLRKYVVKGGAFPVELLEQAGASNGCRDFILRAMAPLARQRMASSEAKEHSWVEASRDVTVDNPVFSSAYWCAREYVWCAGTAGK